MAEIWGAAIGGLAVAGGTVAAANMGPDGSPVGQRDPAAELRDSFGALQDIAPDRFAMVQKYAPLYTGIDTGRDRQVREASLEDVTALGRGFQSAAEAADPELFGLRRDLIGEARGALDRGGALSAEEQRSAEQQARSAFSSRGLALGKSAALAELLNTDSMRRRRLEEDRNFAAGVTGIGYGTRFDPTSTVLGISAGGAGSAAYQAADPTGGYFADVHDTNFNAAAAAANSAANNKAALYGAGIGALGQFAGSYFGGPN